MSNENVKQKQLKELQNEIWQIANWLRAAGLNTLQYIEQITDLVYLKMLDDEEKDKELEAEFTGSTYQTRLGNERYRFYNWVEQESSDYVSFLDRLYNELSDINDYHEHDNSGIRRIFKRSNLLIRNQATLYRVVQKLKDIDLKSYSFDIKGAVYEFLLSKMQTEAGQLGQFFTPRHVVDAMIEMANPEIGEQIYDSACGTGAFLTRAFKHVEQKLLDAGVVDNDKWDFLKKEQFYGRDISETTIKICTMNMILHGDGHTKIMQGDSLSYGANQEDQHNKFDVILANPPFGSSAIPTEDLYKFPIKTNNPENLFLQHIFLSLNEGGRACVVVPEGILFRGGAEKKLRQLLLEQGQMEAVISLPAGAFQPYTGVKTDIIFFKKGHSTEKVWFYNVESDGFDLGANRRPISFNDIPDLLKKFKNKEESEKSWFATIEEIKSSDYTLVVARYKKSEITTDYPLVELDKLINIQNGFAFKSDMYSTEGIPVVTIKNVNNNSLDLKEVNFYPEEIALKDYSRFLLQKDDIVITLTGSTTGNGAVGKVALIKESQLPALLNQRVARISVEDNNLMNAKYLFYLLSSDSIRQQVLQVASGSVQKNVSANSIKDIKIPLPPLHVQKQYVKRLEAQEEIIKQTEKTIKLLKETGIDESALTQFPYTEVELGEIAELYGKNIDPTELNEEYSYYIGLEHIESKSSFLVNDFSLTETKTILSNKNYFDSDSILYGKLRPYLEKVYMPNRDGICSTDIIVLKPKGILKEYLFYLLKSDIIVNYSIENSNGATLPRIPSKLLLQCKVPVPSKLHQEEITKQLRLRQEVLKALEDNKKVSKITLQTIISELFK